MALRPIDDVATRSLDPGIGIEEPLWRDEGWWRPASDGEDLESSNGEDGAAIGSVERFPPELCSVRVRSNGRCSRTPKVADQSSRGSGPAINRLTLFRCHRDGSIEELPDLALELDRSRGTDEQDWSDVDPTRSTLEERPWNPLVGYCCVYESFFGEDSKLWFPIPRLITFYCFRRDIALSQLMNGAVRIAVALMVMAAAIDVSMSVRVFEELTQAQPKPNGLYSLQMRSGLNILTSPLVKTNRWQRSYFYVKAYEAGFEDPLDIDRRVLWSHHIVGHPNTFGPWDPFRRDLPKIVALRPQEWRDFTRERICRQRGRITRVDWSSNVPCEEPKGKRLKLPIMGTSSKVYPDYSETLAAQLRDASFGPSTSVDGTSSAVAGALIDRAPASVAIDPVIKGSVDVRPPKKKRKRNKSSKGVRVDPPLNEEGEEAIRTPPEPRDDGDDDEAEEVREDIVIEIATDQPRDGS
ncbi:hypothetical protein DY000_02022217 [Brassica cretica]|uniref:Aminotransferase-like plant mobile domain-containing protein n=1 Tax=Brassica cretica TaxID=69181 RepID=A0ABQ7E9H4_BRACR|nr:hypothetical protein DY000_02022217 [Brassica cretica]